MRRKHGDASIWADPPQLINEVQAVALRQLDIKQNYIRLLIPSQ